jgi:hypothetical protein
MAVCMSRLVMETTSVWRSLKAVRYIAGSVANSEVYSDQCGHGEEMVGERFMKSVLDRVSIICGFNSFASGVDSSMSLPDLTRPGCSGCSNCSRCSDLIEVSGYTHSPVFRRTQLLQGVPRSHFSLDFLHEAHALEHVSVVHILRSLPHTLRLLFHPFVEVLPHLQAGTLSLAVGQGRGHPQSSQLSQA